MTITDAARAIRAIITSDDESVWLDLPQIMQAIPAALSAFLSSELQNEQSRSMFSVKSQAFTITTPGEIDFASLPSWILGVLDKCEIFLGTWQYPVRIVSTRDRINYGSVTDAAYIHAYREGTKLILSTDTVGAFGGGKIDDVSGVILVPAADLDVANLPELLQGKFTAFAADFIKDQVLRRT